MASLALIWDLIAVDKASGTFNRVAVSADRAAASTAKAETGLTGFGKKAAAALGALATIDIAAHFVKDAAQFQSSMLKIQTQAGASAAQVKLFSSAVLGMAGKVGTAPEELSTSLYHVYSALNKLGATAPQMLNTVKIAAEGAKVGGADLEDTTNALTATMASGIVSYKDAAKAMGYLNSIVGAGDMKFTDLNEALGTGLLVTMKVFGVSLKDTGAALAVFGDNNIRGSDAATKLRMAVQDLAKPAANADQVLSKIHLTSDQLRTSLEQGGLNGALQLLRDRLDAAGITGKQVGGFLEDAFTKRAGAGLAILLTRLKQFDEARDQETKAAGSFGSAWAATTQTAGFAFDKLGAQFDAWAIEIGTKLLPAVTDLANWLGANLPKAVHALGQILSPLASAVGSVLVGAFKALGVAVKAVFAVLESAGRFISSNSAAFKILATVVLSMWAAFKGYTIVRAATLAVEAWGAKVEAVATKSAASGFTSLFASMAGGAGRLAGTLSGPLSLGIGAAVSALTIGIGVWKSSADVQAKVDAEAKNLIGTLNKQTGAVTKLTVATQAQQLEQDGVLKSAQQLGLNLHAVAEAATGNRDATMQVAAAYREYMAARDKALGPNGTTVTAEFGKLQNLWPAWEKVANAIGMGKAATDQASASQRRIAAALAASKGAADSDAQSVHAVTIATQQFKDATSALKDALKGTDAALNNAAAAVAYQQSLNDLTQTFKQNKGAIEGHTNAALADKAAFIQVGQTIADKAGQMLKSGKSWQTVTGYIQTQYAALRQHATDAGADGNQVDRLAKKLHLLPSQIKAEILLDTRSALNEIATVQRAISNINGTIILHTRYAGGAASSVGATLGLASGGTVPGVGHHDTVPAMLTPGEEVTPKRQATKYRSLLKAIAADAVGFFAGGGTVGNALGNANSALGAVTGAPSSPPISPSGFSWWAFVSQLTAAAQAVGAALRAGASKSQMAALNQHLALLNKRGEAVERRLQRQAVSALAHTDLSGTGADVLGRLRTEESGLTALGLPKSFVNGLRDDNRKIVDAVRAQNVAVKHLAAAEQVLANARQNARQDRSSFASAVTGTFDITSAGANPVTGQITGGSILAQAKQAAARAKLWLSGMTKLAGMHIFPRGYLRQLFAKGPDTLEQVQALLSMPLGQLRQLAQTEQQIAGIGAQAGLRGGFALDAGAVSHAQAQVRRDKQIENRREKHLEQMKDDIVHAIREEFGRLQPIPEDTLVGIINRGNRKAKRR